MLSGIEQAFIQEALALCNGNKVRAASILGMSRDRLRYRLAAVPSTGAKIDG
jgi:DNA-binding protein Fis